MIDGRGFSKPPSSALRENEMQDANDRRQDTVCCPFLMFSSPLTDHACSRDPNMLAPHLRHHCDAGPRADHEPARRPQERQDDGPDLSARHRAHRPALQRQPGVQQHGVPILERGLYPDAQGRRARGRPADGLGLGRRGALAQAVPQHPAHRLRRRPGQLRRDRLQLGRLPIPARRHRLRGHAPHHDPGAAVGRHPEDGPARQPVLLRARLRRHERHHRHRLRGQQLQPGRPLQGGLRPAAAQRHGGLYAQREQRVPGTSPPIPSFLLPFRQFPNMSSPNRPNSRSAKPRASS